MADGERVTGELPSTVQSSRGRKLPRFLAHQMRQVRAGGWRVLARKARALVRVGTGGIQSLTGALVVSIVMALRPFILLRFGTIRSDRIGHFAIDVEAYLCARDRGKVGHRTLDIIGCPEPVCNRQLQTMWARTFTTTPGAKLWSFLDRACQQRTGGNMHHVKLYDRVSDYHLLSTTEPHLFFTEQEEQRGRQLLQHLGMPIDAPYVCLHNKDVAYHEKRLGVHAAGDDDYRDFSVQTMASAAEELSRRGYYVVRVGSTVAEALESPDPKVIDYANSPLQSDFADIFLLASAALLLGNDSGICCVPMVFRRPVAMVNFACVSSIGRVSWGSWVISFKRAWHKDERRLLGLRELFETGLADAYYSHLYEQAGVELICNTPSEILDLAVEADERLKGRWQPQPGDEALQQRFWDIFRHYVPPDSPGSTEARIGAAFLRKHADLLV